MVVAALAGLMARRPVIWHLRDVITADHFSAAHRRMVRLLSNRFVSRVIANSETTREAFILNGGHASRVVTIHNGIAEAPFQSIRRDEVERLKRELGLNGAPIVGVFSRLARWKGQHVLLDALGGMPDVHALFVGEALFREDGAYAIALRQQAERLALEHRVHFLGFRHDVPQLLGLVDVVVHTSTSPEPFGRVIVEGMLAGRPVVATRGGGASEIIDDGRTGRLVEPGDAGALAHILNELLHDGGRARAMAEAGRDDAAHRFGLSGMLRKIERCLHEVVGIESAAAKETPAVVPVS
jgi:glycosyltransferase involved in cell wall biosynthesis